MNSEGLFAAHDPQEARAGKTVRIAGKMGSEAKGCLTGLATASQRILKRLSGPLEVHLRSYSDVCTETLCGEREACGKETGPSYLAAFSLFPLVDFDAVENRFPGQSACTIKPLGSPREARGRHAAG